MHGPLNLRWLYSLLSSVLQASSKLISGHDCSFRDLPDSLLAFRPIIRASDTGLKKKRTKINRLIAGHQRGTYCSWSVYTHLFILMYQVQGWTHRFVAMVTTNFDADASSPIECTGRWWVCYANIVCIVASFRCLVCICCWLAVCIVAVILCVFIVPCVCIAFIFALDAGLLARSQYSEKSCDRPPQHRFFLVSLCL